MKNTFFIFTKSRMGLDKGVWITMLSILMISLFILGFKAITKVDCSVDAIIASGISQQTNNIFSVGEPITFSIPSISKPAEKIEWSFDDGTVLQKGSKVIRHIFFKEGNFNVTCTVDDKCQQSVLIIIISAPLKLKDDSTAFAGDPIIGMDTITAGTIVHYSTLIKANYNYQWSSSAAPATQTTQSADFTFYKDGPQNVTLKIDGNKSYNKPIIVLPKKSSDVTKPSYTNEPVKPIPIPPAIISVDPLSGGPGTVVTITGSFLGGTKSVMFGGVEAKFKIVSTTVVTATIGEGASGPVTVETDVSPTTFTNPPFTYIAPVVKAAPSPTAAVKMVVIITDKQLKLLLGKVVDNTMHAQDFDRYFCAGANTKVYVNNAKAPVSFSDLCQQQLQGKKVEIESAQIFKDPDNPACETNLVVKYKKTGGFLKKIFK